MNADAKKHAAAFGWFGVLAVAVFSIIWLACYSVDTSWVWGKNSISDFGISDTDAASFFKYGCAIVGVLLAIFGIGEVVNKKKFGYVFSGIMVVLTGICVIIVGFADLNYKGGDIHHFFAILAAIFAAASAIAWSAQSWKCGREVVAGIPIVLSCVVLACLFAYPFEKFEVIAMVMALIWYGLYSAGTIGYNVKE